MNFHTTKWFNPYTFEDGKRRCSLKTSKALSGVYIIKHLNSQTNKFEIIYVGMSGSDVKRVLYRHFQKWTDKRPQWKKAMSKHDRVTYYEKNFPNEEYLCKVVFTNEERKAYMLEESLILKIQPRDNKLKTRMYIAVRKEIDQAFKEAKNINFNEEVPF